MEQNRVGKQNTCCLSDKDIQLMRKTYLKLTQLYYQNTNNQNTISDIIHLGQLITQVIHNKRESDVLSLIPITQSLKVKSKSRPDILQHIEQTVNHLRFPNQNQLKYETLLYSLQTSDLFTVGCTSAIRFYDRIQVNSGDFNWKQIIQELSRNVSISPNLSIELGFLICKESEIYSRWAVKSGLAKYVFLSYVDLTLENKFLLYKAIKLIKVIANADGTLLRQKQQSLALVIYTYEDYIPVIEGIIAKCYDSEYSQAIDNKRKYDQQSLDQPYLWSYLEQYCLNNLSDNTIVQLIKRLRQPLNEKVQTKIYGILANYAKYKKKMIKEVLEIMPRSEKSLLNFIKFCVNSCEIDHSSSTYIQMTKLEGLVDKSPNQKVSNLFKYLKEIGSKDAKIGVLSENYKKIFDMEKNADLMMERAAKIPQNNEQLSDIKQILKEKDRSNEFQSDTLKTVKERALNSLNTAIMQKKKIDLNIVLREVDLGDIKILAKLLQILELCLTMNEEMVQKIDRKKVLQIIQWIEQNYKGEMIQWGSISQLMVLLIPEGEWKKHLKEIPSKCFWLMNIQVLGEEDQVILQKKLTEIESQLAEYQHKIPFLIGFLSKSLINDSKLKLFQKCPKIFLILSQNIKNNSGSAYKTTLIMYKAFIREWFTEDGDQTDKENNKAFLQNIISPLSVVVANNFRSLDQEYGFLQNCLPYDFRSDFMRDNLDYLISLYGKLASFIYKKAEKEGARLVVGYDRIKALTTLPLQNSKNILQLLTFLEDNSQLLHGQEISIFLEKLITNKKAYWFVYPFFYNIFSKLLSLLSKTNNSEIKASCSKILCKIIAYIIGNAELSEDEKDDLFSEIKKCLEILALKHGFIDKEAIKKAVEKILNKQIKNQILQILKNYQIIEQKNIGDKPKSHDGDRSQDKPQMSELSSNVKVNFISQLIKHEFSAQEQKEQGSSVVNIDELDFKMGQDQLQLRLIDALRILKRIIQKKEPQEKFPSLYNIFIKEQFKVQYKDILGQLLAMFYPLRPKQMQKQALQLLLNSQKTRLSKESCYKLLKECPQTFCLSRRWRLFGRQWLDLSMLRFSEGLISDSCQVAEQNINNNTELQYFLAKGYHELISKVDLSVLREEDLVYLLLLVGTSTRNNHVKFLYFKQKIHIKILSLITNHQENKKLIGNILYALSSMVYMQPEVCIDLIKEKQLLQLLFNCVKKEGQNKNMVQSGACLLANLSYSSQEVKEVLRHLNVIQIFLFLFESVIPLGELSTFKQILRAFGNLSLSLKCTQELIDQHFCSLAVQMSQKLGIITSVDDKIQMLIKLLVDLIANLASHRYRLQVFHREKVTMVLLAILETTKSNIPLLMSCIDTIDCLCQSTQIQNYMVTQKKIAYILIDILKIQTDEKITVKSTRLLTNLTINSACIPHILNANLLSVLANIVLPHFFGCKTEGDLSKKMETYIMKIMSRIYHSKIDKDTLIKSGYLDCLVTMIENIQNVDDVYIDILYYFADIVPNHLNKRAFICLVKILTKKITVKDIVLKCFGAIKKLSSYYSKKQPDFFVPKTSELYEQLLTSEFKDEGLELLCYHLLRSDKLRQLLRSKQSKVLSLVKKMGENNNYGQSCKQILFLAYNPFVSFENIQTITQNEHYQELKKGFKCKLFRLDGSSKKAVIDMNDEYEIRAYKFPDGEIKKKYIIDIKNIKDFQFNYSISEELWSSTVFSIEKGLFDSKKCDPRNCCTLISSKKWGEISFVNVEFESQPEKNRFYLCLGSLYNSLR